MNITKIINALIIGSIMTVASCLLAFFAMACTNDNEAQRALSDQGFSNISIVDRGAWFSSFHGCSDSDGNWYSVTADNAKGERVNMTVCCGGAMQYKGCTLRSK